MVEIVRTTLTSDATVAGVREFFIRLGLKSIMVRDSPGFFSTRVSGSFLNEGMALLGEGVAADLVERSALEAGMRSGPLAALDEISLKLSDELLHQELHDLEHRAQSDASEQPAGGLKAAHDHDHDHDHDHAHDHAHDHDHDHAIDQGHHRANVHDHSHDHSHLEAHDHAHDHDHGPTRSAAEPAATSTNQAHKHARKVKSRRLTEPAVYVMEKMAHGFRRIGREAGAGFYDYDDDGSATLWSGLKAFERRAVSVAGEDVRDRLLFIQSLETFRCLDEGVVASLEDADFATIAGCGFPASTGGAARFVTQMGTGKFVARTCELADRYGDRFLPPEWLVKLAGRNEPLDAHYRDPGQPASA